MEGGMVPREEWWWWWWPVDECREDDPTLLFEELFMFSKPDTALLPYPEIGLPPPPSRLSFPIGGIFLD